MHGLFPCVPIFGVFFRLKSVKKWVCLIVLKLALLPVKNKFINMKKAMSDFGA